MARGEGSRLAPAGRRRVDGSLQLRSARGRPGHALDAAVDALVDVAQRGRSLGVHLVLRWRASYADPIILPIATLLNGIGLVMIHRLDLAAGRDFSSGLALRQLIWTGIGVAIALVVLVALLACLQFFAARERDR